MSKKPETFPGAHPSQRPEADRPTYRVMDRDGFILAETESLRDAQRVARNRRAAFRVVDAVTGTHWNVEK
jgi:hypothetical protein